MSDPYDGQSSTQDVPGVSGTNTAEGDGVFGTGMRGVHGVSETGSGVYAQSRSGRAVEGWSETNYGVTGDSRTFPGVRGSSVEGRGIEGWSTKNDGVWGITTGNIRGAAGVHGVSEGQGIGVFGQSASDDGVRGVSTHQNGVSAFGGHTGVYAEGPVNAGYFKGNVEVTGVLTQHGVPISQQFGDLGHQVTGLQQQVTSLHQLVNSLQSQLASLQTKEAQDVQGIAVSLATLAARVTNLGG